jgi:hypothetical protein
MIERRRAYRLQVCRDGLAQQLHERYVFGRVEGPVTSAPIMRQFRIGECVQLSAGEMPTVQADEDSRSAGNLIGLVDDELGEGRLSGGRYTCKTYQETGR